MNTTVTKETFNSLKEQYGHVFCVTILDCDYAFRTFTGAEWTLYLNALKLKNETQMNNLAKNLILFPSKEDIEARSEINGMLWFSLIEVMVKTFNEKMVAKEKVF